MFITERKCLIRSIWAINKQISGLFLSSKTSSEETSVVPELSFNLDHRRLKTLILLTYGGKKICIKNFVSAFYVCKLRFHFKDLQLRSDVSLCLQSIQKKPSGFKLHRPGISPNVRREPLKCEDPSGPDGVFGSSVSLNIRRCSVSRVRGGFTAEGCVCTKINSMSPFDVRKSWMFLLNKFNHKPKSSTKSPHSDTRVRFKGESVFSVLW